jgi:WD40 repeat protein/uncharacterized caspase-like protein
MRALGLVTLLLLRAAGQSPAPVFQPNTSGNSLSFSIFGGGGNWTATLPFSLQGSFSIQITSAISGHLVRTISDDQDKKITRFTADSEKDRIAIALESAEIAVFDVTTGAQIWRTTLPASTKNGQVAVHDLRFSANGAQLLAVVGITPPSRLRMPKTEVAWYAWDAATGKLQDSRPLPTLESFVYGASFSEDARLVAVNLMTKSVILDPLTGKTTGPELDGRVIDLNIQARRALVTHVRRSPISISTRLIDTDTGKEISSNIPEHSNGAFSPDGKTLVVVGSEIGWRVINPENGQVKFPGDGALPYVSGTVSFNRDGTHFLVSDATGGAMIVDSQDPIQYRRLGGKVEVQPGQPILKAGDFTTRAMTPQREQEIKSDYQQLFKQIGGPGIAPVAAFTKNGQWLVTRSADGALDFFDVASGNRVPFRVPIELDLTQGKFPPLSVAAERRYVYVRSEVKQVQALANMKYSNPGLLTPRRTSVVQAPIEQGAFSSQVVDTASGKIVRTTAFRNVQCISNGGEYAIEATTDRRGKITETLKAANGSADEDLSSGVSDFAGGCSISHTGRFIVVATADKRQKGYPIGQSMERENYGERFGQRKANLHIYDVQARKVIATLTDESGKEEKFSFSPGSLKWTPDDRFLVGGGGGATAFDKHGPVRVFEAATGRQIHAIPGTEQSTPRELAPDGSLLITTTGRDSLPQVSSFGVEARETVSGMILFRLPDASTEPDSLAFSPNGKTIIGPDRSEAISIWSRTDGKLLGQFRPLQQGEWLVQSASGLFDGSRRAWPLLSWREPNGKVDVSAAELYFSEFYRPGLLADLIENRDLPPQTLSEVDRRQPKVVLDAGGTTDTTRLRIIATEAPPDAAHPKGTGVKDLRLFRNGRLIRAWRGQLTLDAKGSAAFEVTVATTPGENRFTAYVFNGDNIKSQDAVAVVRRPGTPMLGIAYILAIGVNRYANSDFNLQFAAPDAETMAAEFTKKQRDLAQFSSVEPILLLDEAATAANIKLALRLFAREQIGTLPPNTPTILTKIRPLKPEDTLIVYFAGHGISSGDRFYLVPHDLGYTGPKAGIGENLSTIFDHGISDQYLETALEPLDAQHILLIIDACRSGQALEAEEVRRGPMNNRGLAQLAWEKGISILAASQADQNAIETEDLKHGYLTFALAQEGLQTPVADSAPVDGLITDTEWLEYATYRVPQLQIEGQDQKDKRAFAHPSEGSEAFVQTPRLFTPRDAPGTPLIVAKFQ